MQRVKSSKSKLKAPKRRVVREGVYAASLTTREKLLNAAEQLFAERGFDAVSLREIGRAAGQRNTASARYHFGDKAGLIGELIVSRSISLNREREQILSTALHGSRRVQLRTVAEAIARPHLELLRRGQKFGAILSRIFMEFPASPKAKISHPPHVKLAWQRSLWFAWPMVTARMTAIFPEFTEEQIQRRLIFACGALLAFVAQRVTEERMNSAHLVPLHEVEGDVLNGVFAILNAPI